MGPIRVALVGLTSTSPEEYEGVAWAELAHLRFLSASSSYKIVALLNSSVESAKAAVERYGLPVETKTYDNPEGMWLTSLPIGTYGWMEAPCRMLSLDVPC
jgi:predicted dehydrogenase